MSLQKALQRIKQEKIARTGELDLSELKLISIPNLAEPVPKSKKQKAKKSYLQVMENEFVKKYNTKLQGVLSCYDRIVIKGTLPKEREKNKCRFSA